MHPVARIMELGGGHDIQTTWRYVTDGSNVVHRQGFRAVQGAATMSAGKLTATMTQPATMGKTFSLDDGTAGK